MANQFLAIVEPIREYAVEMAAQAKQVALRMVQSARFYQLQFSLLLQQWFIWARQTLPRVILSTKQAAYTALINTIEYLRNRPKAISQYVLWLMQQITLGIEQSFIWVWQAARFCWYYFQLGWRYCFQFILNLPNHILYGLRQLAVFIKFLSRLTLELCKTTYQLLKTFVVELANLSQQLLLACWRLILRIPNAIKQFCSALYSEALEILKAVKDSLWYIAKQFWRAIQFIPTLLSKLAQAIRYTANLIFQATKTLLRYIADGVISALRALPRFIMDVYQAIRVSLARIIHLVTSAIKRLANWTLELFKFIPKVLNQLCSLANKLANWTLELIKAIPDALNQAWSLTKVIFTTVAQGLKMSLQVMREVARQLIHSIHNAAVYIAEQFLHLIYQIPNALKAIQRLLLQSLDAIRQISYYLIKEFSAKAMFFGGTWYGVHLAIVDLAVDALNFTLTSAFGMNIANLAFLEPTKMLLGGVLAAYTAYAAVRLTFIGIGALTAMAVAYFNKKPIPLQNEHEKELQLNEELDTTVENALGSVPEPALTRQYEQKQQSAQASANDRLHMPEDGYTNHDRVRIQ